MDIPILLEKQGTLLISGKNFWDGVHLQYFASAFSNLGALLDELGNEFWRFIQYPCVFETTF